MYPVCISAWRCTALALVLLTLSGCATGRDPRDPLEPFNRNVYKFNDAVDRAVLKPVAKGYTAVVPAPVRGGVGNFFGNFRDVTNAVNDLLQAKFGAAASDVGRVVINTTVGLLGVFDVASRLGLEKHNEDFGQTLGVWGVKPGAYLVLPILGPSTVRDTVGLVGDYFTDPEFYLFTHSPESFEVGAVRIIQVRSELLDSEKIFDAAAIDRYAFLRDAYLQRRRSLIFDGRAPSGTDGPPHKTLKQLEDELDIDDPAVTTDPAPTPGADTILTPSEQPKAEEPKAEQPQ